MKIIKVSYDPRGRGNIIMNDGRKAYLDLEAMCDLVEDAGKAGAVIDTSMPLRGCVNQALAFFRQNGGFRFE
jgi:hypothetical protein